MSGTGLPGSEPEAREAPRQKPAGAWIGYLIFALILLFQIVIDAQAAYEREWANFTGITLFTLAFLVVPTGGLRWLLRRAAQARKPPAHRL
jgi:protein-S-isoprenylcysteine O-methyltransferase Ste14